MRVLLRVLLLAFQRASVSSSRVLFSGLAVKAEALDKELSFEALSKNPEWNGKLGNA